MSHVVGNIRSDTVSTGGKKVKHISSEEAQQRLLALGIEIGTWNQLHEVPGRGVLDSSIHVQAPRDARVLLNFAQHVVGWLPAGAWKILQLDYSNALDLVDASLFVGFLAGVVETTTPLPEVRTLLFEFGQDQEENQSTELLIANLVFVLLVLEGHATLVSSDAAAKRYLSVQDGFVYFVADIQGISDANCLLRGLEIEPLRAPQWVNAILEGAQTSSVPR